MGPKTNDRSGASAPGTDDTRRAARGVRRTARRALIAGVLVAPLAFAAPAAAAAPGDGLPPGLAKQLDKVLGGRWADYVPAPTPQPAPAPTPTEPAPAPKPTEPAPAPKPTEPAPAPKPTEPAPAPKPTQPAPAPAPTQPAPAPAPAPEEPAPATSTSTLLAEYFTGSDGNWVTSGAFWGRSDLGSSENPNWFAESGSMYRRSGTGYARSGTFRIWTRNKSFGNIRVEMDLKLNSLPNLRGSTAGWDGVKFWLRRGLQTPGPGGRVDDGRTSGYTAEVALRDGRVYIQKKVGDNYYMLSSTPSKPMPLGSFRKVGGVVRTNADGSVTIQVLRDGQVVVQAIDRGAKGGAPLRAAGRIGLRSDNADYNVDNLRVTPAS
jgi:hypothetical protein